MPESWHHQGLFMGMHWAWWLFWIATVAIVLWAFARLATDRRATHREAERVRVLEDALRERHDRGEIDDQQLAHELIALTRSGSRPRS